jgi:hypothetical protein
MDVNFQGVPTDLFGRTMGFHGEAAVAPVE